MTRLDLGTITGRVLLKTQKCYLMPLCLTLSIIRYASRGGEAIQGKEEHPPQHLGVVAIEKGAFGLPRQVGQLKYIYIYANFYVSKWSKFLRRSFMTPLDSIKDVVRSFVKVPEFDKHLKKAGGHIGRNIVEITIKVKTIARKPLMIKILRVLQKIHRLLPMKKGERTSPKWCPQYDTKLHPVVKFQFWSLWERGHSFTVINPKTIQKRSGNTSHSQAMVIMNMIEMMFRDVLGCNVVVSEFELYSRSYVHFQINTLWKGMNPLILPAMG